MATKAFKAGYELRIGDGAEPEVFSVLEEVNSISGLGKTNSSIEVTHFGSGNNKEFISGRADGQEMSITCNQVLDSATQAAVIAKVDAGESGNIEIFIDNGTIQKTYTMEVAYLSWSFGPQLDGANTLEFSAKISGDIVAS